MAKKPYPPGTGAFVDWCSVDMGSLFRIPDMRGGYGRCCGDESAVFEMVQVGGFPGPRAGMKCVACDEVTPFGATMVQLLEIVTVKG